VIDEPVVIVGEIPVANREVLQDSLDVRLDTAGNDARDRWSWWVIVDGIKDFVAESLANSRGGRSILDLVLGQRGVIVMAPFFCRRRRF